MIVTRRIRIRHIWKLIAATMLVGALWAVVVLALYGYADLKMLRVPFLPLSTIGTAVAFYVGLKNNSAYDRFWEARKIWGGIVNSSRTFSATVLHHIVDDDKDPGELAAIHKDLVYRHLAWVNALRLQLRKVSRFHDKPARSTKRRLIAHKDAMRNDWDLELMPFLSQAELADVTAKQNPATHLLAKQTKTLAELQRAGNIDVFHHTALSELIAELYTHQGKCERIKNTPFPRQYAEISRLFTYIFCFFVPFGMLDVFGDDAFDFTDAASLLTGIPMVVASALVIWVFFTLEGVGDSSEDPFERSMNDVPMNALSRTIEIDLREMLGEKDLPAKEPAAALGAFEVLY